MSILVPSWPSVVTRRPRVAVRGEEGDPLNNLQVRPCRSMAERFRRPASGRLIACLVASLVMHGAAVAAFVYVRPATSWKWVAVQSGRASIELQASVAVVASQGEPDWEVQPIPILPDRTETSPEETPLEIAETQHLTLERPADASEPLPLSPSKGPSESIVLAEFEVSLADESPELPTDRLSSPAPSMAASASGPAMRRVNVGLRHADALAEQLAESLPSIASQASQGADSDLPELVSNPAPAYPAEALAAKVTGRVIVRVELAADGAVVLASVYRSSGSALLDEAALNAVRTWRFAPAEGNVAPRRLAVPINFVIHQEARNTR